jgi:hypothetical protein
MFYKEEDELLINYLISELKDENLRYELAHLFELTKNRCEYYKEEIVCVNPYVLKSLLIEYTENQIRFIIHKSYNSELEFSRSQIEILAKYGVYHKFENQIEEIPIAELETFFLNKE